MLINFGRLLMLCVWAFLLLNLFQPFPKPLNIFVNVALIFMILIRAGPYFHLRRVRTGRLAEKAQGDPEEEVMPGKGSGIWRKAHKPRTFIAQDAFIADA